MIDKRKVITIILIVQMSVCLFAGSIYLVANFLSGNLQFHSDVEIKEMSVCDINNNINNENRIVLNHTQIDSYQLNFCGELVTSAPANIWLLVYKDSIDKPVANRDFDKIENGAFNLPILIPASNIEGIYHANIMVRRQVISTISFDVIIK